MRLFAAETPVRTAPDGRLVYETEPGGDRLPDFSHCGYAGAECAIPNVPGVLRVVPQKGDDGRQIQSAIDFVAGLPVNKDGFRGAVVLAPGPLTSPDS